VPLNPTTIHRPVRDVSWDYEGAVVLVTGGAHGQGASHALAFAEAGADIAICDIAAEMEYVNYPLGTLEELEEVAEAVRGLGRRCLPVVCDVRQADQVRDFVERTDADLGRIDVAVANAGIGPPGYLHEIDLAQWEMTIATDLDGAFYTCKHAARQMIAAGNRGRLVVTGSTQTFGATTWTGPYTAAKHGLLRLVEGFAAELEPHGIGINLVCPTAVDTSIGAPFATDPRYPAWAEEAGALLGSWNILGDGGSLHEREVTEAILWLASGEARGVSGTALMVDGGCMSK
jgi:NAD(P)-dependent dehydrogenase (short-subunit alcohol dehydrogenase family)